MLAFAGAGSSALLSHAVAGGRTHGHRGHTTTLRTTTATTTTPGTTTTTPTTTTAAGTTTTTTTATTTTPQPQATAPLLPSSGKTWFGSSTNDAIPVATIEGSILNNERKLDIVHSYKMLDSYVGTKSFPGYGDDGTSLQRLSDGGRTLFLNIQFKINKLYPAGTDTWSNVASGVYDSGYLIPLAQKIAAWYSTYHRKLFISLDHEADGHYGLGVQGTSYGQFADAWRHVYDVFAAYGARDACAFVFNMAGYKARVHEWNLLYPGDAYVDWLGYDAYGRVEAQTNYGPPDAAASVTFGQDESEPGVDDTGFSRFYKWAVGPGAKDPGNDLTYTKPGSHTMPVMLGEFGLSYNPATADATYLSQYRQWWSDFVDLLAAGRYPQIRAMVFFPSLPTYDPRLDVGSGTVASPEADSILAGFRRLAGLPRLNQ
jgi:Glycosyl hydrolase family 26